MKNTLIVLMIALFVGTITCDCSFAWPKKDIFGNPIKRRRRVKTVRKAPAQSANLTQEQKEANGVLDRFVKKPQTVEIPDEASFGDTVTAKIINSYGRPLLDKNKYADVWDYCNLIALALSKVEPLRPRIRYDSDYVPPRINDPSLPKEDKKLLRNIGWHVGIIDSPEVGGCSAPGGYILVTTGLLKACRNEAELAGIIAHEMAHIGRSHGLHIIYRGMTKQKNKKAFLGFLSKELSKGKKPGAQILAGLFKSAASSINQYANFEYGHTKEYEADLIGAQYIYRLGYDPNALVTFLNRLKQDRNKAYRSHPATKVRIRRLLQYIREKCPGARDGQTNMMRYRERVISRLP